MTINIIGAGAFGTSLAIALAQKEDVTLWARSLSHAEEMERSRENKRRLPYQTIPENVTITARMDALARNEPILLSIPTQQLAQFLTTHRKAIAGSDLIACCKGIDQKTGLGPVGLMKQFGLSNGVGILSGPSFAVDLAKGLPTALTLATEGCDPLQSRLSTPQMRLYVTEDWRGVELGGALKNVMAIACGIVEGAQLGESARAALLTRGFSEMREYAGRNGADPETLLGLSGLGDLTLTASSQKSRNYRFGICIGQGTEWKSDETVEGKSTATAVAKAAEKEALELPVIQTVAALVEQKITVQTALERLMTRPLRKET